jgi:hypothetical protein
MAFMDYMPQFGKNTTQDVSGMPQDDTMMQLEMQRRLKFADALRQQEMPQGQMVSGIYVAPSITQGLANLANKYVAGQQEQGAMKQYGDYQKTKQKRLADALEGLNTDTAPKAITEQSSYQIQVPDGQATPTDNLGGMQPYNSGMKSIDVPMTNTTGYQPRTAAERDAAIYKFATATQNPELMSKVAFDRIAKQDQQEVLQAQRQYDFLLHKRDRGEKLDDTERANLFALDKMAREQGFTSGQNALSRGVTMRGQNMTNANQPLVAVLDNNGQPTYVPRNEAVGKTPYNQNQAKMTEDQAKASGWLSQANNAYSNMQKVMYKTDEKGAPLVDVSGKPMFNYSVIQPSTKEMLVGALGMPGAAQKAPRQQFVQATESMSEALLRAATGAGVNIDEAKQKVRELTPQYFDKPETINQKIEAIPVYLESLKVRATGGRNLMPNQQSGINGTYNPATGKIE